MPIRVKMPDGRVAQFPDGMPKEEIQAAILKQGMAQPVGDVPQVAPEAVAQPDLLDKALGLLPGAGGLAGGVVGGLVGAAAGGTAGSIIPGAGTAAGIGTGGFLGGATGAALGGGAGEGLRQEIRALIGREETSPQKLAAGVGGAALKEGALQAVGGGLAKGASLTGRAAMQVAGKIPVPEVAETAIREGIKVTRAGRDRLMKRIGQSADQALHYARQATRMGQRYDGLQIARQIMQELGPEISVEPATRAIQMRRLRRLTMSYLGNQPWRVTPERLHLMKKKADDLAAPVYAAMESGEQVGPRTRIMAQWNKSFADKARLYLNTTIQDYEAQNARTAQLIKVKEAIWPEVSKTQGMAAQMMKTLTRPAVGTAAYGVGGASIGAATDPQNRLRGAIGGGLAGAAIGNPMLMSNAALFANNPLLLQALLHAPRTVAAADVLSR